MSRSPTSPFHRRATGRFAAALAGLAVAALTSAPAAGGSDVQIVPLHNDQAQTGTGCPDSIGSFWHFVISPNDNGYAFVSMTLALNGSAWSFSGSQIVPNGGQLDNVFVEVPDGLLVTSLSAAGSSATITPSTGSPKFVLSHVCTGTGTTTTTSTTPRTTTTTTQPESTTTTTTTPLGTTTTSTQPEQPTSTTTSTAPAGTTTTSVASAGGTTTTTQVASAGPTTTASAGTLPATGHGGARTSVIAIGMLAVGVVFVALTRRRLVA